MGKDTLLSSSACQRLYISESYIYYCMDFNLTGKPLQLKVVVDFRRNLQIPVAQDIGYGYIIGRYDEVQCAPESRRKLKISRQPQ